MFTTRILSELGSSPYDLHLSARLEVLNYEFSNSRRISLLGCHRARIIDDYYELQQSPIVLFRRDELDVFDAFFNEHRLSREGVPFMETVERISLIWVDV